MSISSLNTQLINDAGNLCQDPETEGFDLQAGQSWIYPTNYPVRDYQYNIIQEALHKNTLVSLPTGLGKTFIAAVVMYNFFRWYPLDKIIFMAPSRPLVRQQLDACYNIMAIPQEVTAELTGQKVQQSRAEIWQSKRVFFITPQVLQNDLDIIIELGPKIKCLVFDEAHRAKGNHAYCQVIRKLLPTNKIFRVLALSATPGNSSRDVIEVMQNLLIARVEFRSEESPDVKPYVFERALETVVVPLGEKLQQVKDQYLQILGKYAKTLIEKNVIYGNCANLTKGKIFLVMKEFQAKNANTRSPNYGEIMKTLNICVTLYHANETLIRCGLRAFLNFYEEHINNPLLRGNIALRQILEDLRHYLGPPIEIQSLPDGTFTKVPDSAKFGHPKFYKLRDILLAHFKNCDVSTRVIVFFEYRESASEAYSLLSQSHPLIKARVFVGQGSGVRQKDQINTVKAFRDGTCNTLLSTSIGEEGLDVGEVDLIVCFDIANKSPIRMIQRMGRTGRKKEGRVVVLVTEGKEQQTLKDCLIYKNNLGSFVSNSQQLEAGVYLDNPKMIPSYINPKCQKMFITVKKPVLAKNANLKDMLKRIGSNEPKFDEDMEILEINERIKTRVENFWNTESPVDTDFEAPKIDFGKYLEKQRFFQEFGFVKHSKNNEIFVSLMKAADSKRFNIPVTQQNGKFEFTQNKILKQGDIRSMFAKSVTTSLSQETYLPISQNFNFEKEKDITQSFPVELFDEISAFLSIGDSTSKSCKTCNLLFECPKTYSQSENIDLSNWLQPDLSILDSITLKDLEVFADSLTPKSKELLDFEDDIFENVTFSEISETANKSLEYETPRNFDKILESFRICEDEAFPEEEEKSFKWETPKSFAKVLNLMQAEKKKEETEETRPATPKTLNLKKKEEIVVRPRISKKLETIEEHSEDRESSVNNKKEDLGKLLFFFKLSSLEDFFLNSKDQVIDLDETIVYTQDSSLKKTVPLCEESPDLFPSSEEKSCPVPCEEPDSPILCSYERVQSLKAKKKLFDESRTEEFVKKPKLSNLNLQRKSFYESKNRSRAFSKSPEKRPVLELGDICDLSDFMSANKNEENRKEAAVNKVKEDEAKLDKRNKMELTRQESFLDISDICDLSIFGLGPSQVTKEENKNDEKEKNVTKPLQKKMGEELTLNDVCDMSAFFGDQLIEEKEVGNKESSKKDDISDLDDFCDLSYFLDTPKKEGKSDKNFVSTNKNFSNFMNTPKKNKTNENSHNSLVQTPNINTENNVTDPKTVVIDLTDSDLDLSPVKSKPTQDPNKTVSQLSITQMLSLIGKTSGNPSSQKENSSTPKMKKSQKSSLSLSMKKGKGILRPKQKCDSPKLSQKKSNIVTTPKTQTKKLNIAPVGDSDDEFEETWKSPILPRSVKKKEEIRVKPTQKPLKKQKKIFCDFIEDEAVVSEDERIVISEDEDSGEDCFEASFVADETQDFLNTTNMHARYLESVKSPRRGMFKIPQKFKHNISNVFSQEVSNEDNTYINDSFCVNSEDVDGGSPDLSELDILELRLKEMRKNKKRKRSDDGVKTKRRRIIVSNDSD